MEINTLREIVTVASFLAFAGIVAFAYRPKNRVRFDEAARLPLEDDDGCGGPYGRSQRRDH